MNKNLKKLLAFFAAAAMISPILPVSAEETELKDAVWYRNTFDNGADDAVAVDNDYLTLQLGVKADGKPSGAMPDKTVTVDGNVGVRVRKEAWLDGQTLLFTPKTAISEGKYLVSFDMSPDADVADHGDDAWVGYNFTSSWEGKTMTFFKKMDTVGASTPVLGYGVNFGGALNPMDPDKVYHFDYVFDYSDKTAKTYMDGQLIKSASDVVAMNNFNFSLNGTIDYVDNIQFVKIEGETPVMTAKAYAGTNYADVTFSTPVTRGSFVCSDKAISKTVWDGNISARVYFDGIIKKGDTLTLSVDGISGFFGTPLKANSIEIPIGENKNIIYYNTFDKGIEDYKDFKSDEITVTTQPKEPKPTLTAEVDGNKGIKYNTEAYARDVSFKFVPKAPITSGIYTVSFDFKPETNEVCAKHDGDNNSFGLGMANNWDGKRVAYLRPTSNGMIYLPMKTFGDWDDNANAVTLDQSVHSIEFVMDYTTGQSRCYLDGALVKTYTDFNAQYVPTNDFEVTFGGTFAYFDNLKVAYMNETSFTAGKLEAPAVGDTVLRVVPSERIDSTTLSADKVSVTKNGKSITPTEVRAADFGRKIEIALPEGVGADEIYEVTLGAIKSISGYALVDGLNKASAYVNPIRIEDGKVIAKVTNSSNAAVTPTIFAATYEGTTLTGVKSAPADKAIPSGESGEVSLDISELTGEISIFVWNNMSPMINVGKITK